MMKKTSDRECLEAMLRREKPERVIPWEYYTIAVAAIWAGTTVEKAYKKPVVSYNSQKRLADELGILFTPVWECLGDDFGGEGDSSASRYSMGPATIRYPVNSENDIERIISKECSLLTEGIEFTRLAVSEHLDNVVFNSTFNISGPFTKTGHLCGVDTLSRWLIE